MSTILVKKVNYQVVEEVNSYIYKVKDNDKNYLVYDFYDTPNNFLDFKFAYKRLKSTGINIPEVYVLDKKNHRILMEDLVGDSVFDMLIKQDLDEKIIEQAFITNYKARINRLRLDFDPKSFIYKDEKLYYMPFTFTEYKREEDFTQKEIRLWFYTNEFKERLIKEKLPIDQSRIKNEYERNKEIVLLVVKYFR
ncbi:MAG: hypothetical protein K5906_01500 [Bacilli bacterium]|nr:hypothetical protein [Bacilli bacterium]